MVARGLAGVQWEGGRCDRVGTQVHVAVGGSGDFVGIWAVTSTAVLPVVSAVAEGHTGLVWVISYNCV